MDVYNERSVKLAEATRVCALADLCFGLSPVQIRHAKVTQQILTQPGCCTRSACTSLAWGPGSHQTRTKTGRGLAGVARERQASLQVRKGTEFVLLPRASMYR